MVMKKVNIVSVQDRLDNIKLIVKDFNVEVVNVFDQLVDVFFEIGVKWQKLMVKVLD